MRKHRIASIFLIAALAFLAYFSYASQKSGSVFSRFPFKLGLDLAGGTELTYRADVSQLKGADVGGAMSTLRDVIERRVNPNGVGETAVQVENAGVLAGKGVENRLIVELPGVTDVGKAVEIIGQTPTLDFLLAKDNAFENLANASTTASTTKQLGDYFIATGLNGRFLDSVQLEFDQTTGAPIVGLSFNEEGKNLFAKITKENTGRIMAIFLDGKIISAPVIREEIPNGKAQISGKFTVQEARDLVRNLNYGALPVPIELVSTQTVGASLGQDALKSGIRAGIWGFLLVAIFLLVWYRLPGFVATVALVMYVLISLAIFKLIPITLTAAGIAGFILSIGMAVDANILIFERTKEEIKRGRDIEDAVKEGFHRAWLSIRDSNISSIITALVLFWVGTSAVKGFALTLGLGVLVSMFTAITVSRTFLFALSLKKTNRLTKFLYGSGIK